MNDPQNPQKSPGGYPSVLGGGGFYLLINVPEFQLFEYRNPEFPDRSGEIKIEWSPKIVTAYLKALGRFQKDSKINLTEDRAEFLWALSGLFDYSKREKEHPGSGEGADTSMKKFASTLGSKLLEIEAADSEREVDERCDEAISLCSTVLRGFTTWKKELPDGRSNSRKPNEISVFREAEFLIGIRRECPDKSTIRMLVEAKGEVFTGKNIKADWNRIFTNIGFANFPDFPASI